MEQEMVLLKQFEKDSAWFHHNIRSLISKGFGGKFVAIKSSKPIASNKDINVVIKELENKGENPSFIFVEFVHPEGYTLVL